MEEKKVDVGVIGFGTVGAGVVKTILDNGDVIAKRTGIRLRINKIADLDIVSDRGFAVPEGVLTTDANEVIDNSDIVVELVGGTTKAKDFILRALGLGKPVVTANKALLAEHGEEVFAAAEKSHADIFYDASVAGGIPIIKALKEGLVANRINSIHGILNGTCNYILTRMENEGIEFDSILADAQRLGYAEADPSLDIDGFDTAHKAVILGSLAYGKWFGMNPVHVEGIRGISLLDISYAAELGYRIKMLAIIKQEDGDVQIRVHPTLVPVSSMIAQVSDAFNAVMVDGNPVGQTLFYGRGAGRDATASAVVADIVDVGLNLQFGSHRRVSAFRVNPQFRNLTDMSEVRSRYYLRLQVRDQPGVLAKVAATLGDKQISIASLIQKEGQSEENVTMIILTHEAVEESLLAAVASIHQLGECRDQSVVFRVEDI